MGYSSGKFSGRGSGQKYSMDSFMIGKCNAGDKWESCTGGRNDYQVAGYSCHLNKPVKITIKCYGGGSTETTSCRGTQF